MNLKQSKLFINRKPHHRKFPIHGVMLFFLLALWILWEKLFNELIFEERRKTQVRIKQANNLHEWTKKYPNGKMNFIQLTKFGFFELAAPDSCWLHNSNVTFCHGKQQLCLQWGLERVQEFWGLPEACIQPSYSTGTLHRITAIGQTGLKKKILMNMMSFMLLSHLPAPHFEPSFHEDIHGRYSWYSC